MNTDAALALTDVAVATELKSRDRAQRRERQAIAEFERHVTEQRDNLFRFAFWLTRDPHLADDAVQEALKRAWCAWPKLRDKGAVAAWLKTIVKRECARQFERNRLPTRDIDELTAAEQYLVSVEDDPEIGDVRRALLRLDETYREPLVLQVLMGHSTEEIAGILGIKRGAVLTRLCRARRKLADELGCDAR